MEITIIPLEGKGSGFSGFVAGLQVRLRQSGCSFALNDMGTIVEGPAPRLFELAAALHEEGFSGGSARVYTIMKIDDRRDRQVRLGEKTASVAAMVGPGAE